MKKINRWFKRKILGMFAERSYVKTRGELWKLEINEGYSFAGLVRTRNPKWMAAYREYVAAKHNKWRRR